MDQELTERLIEVRKRLDVIEAVGGLYLDMSEMAAHVTELIQMRAELEEIYNAERERIGDMTSVSESDEVVLNAVVETLETAHGTATWLAVELCTASPEYAQGPEIMEFVNTVREMHDGMGELGQQLAEPELDMIVMPDDQK